MPKLPRGITRKKGRPGYYVRDQRGGQDRWVKAGDSLNEARKVLDRVRGRTVRVGRMTVEDAAKKWLEGAVAVSRNERVAALAGTRIHSHLVPALGARPLSALTGDDCRAYRLGLEEKKLGKEEDRKLTPQTVAHILADFRAMLFWCVDEGYLDRSPFPRRLLPRIQERAPIPLAEEVVAKLVALPEPYGFTLRLLLGTGLRWGEAVRAEARHVERGALVVTVTKSGRMRRIPLPPALLKEIEGRVGRLLPLTSSSSFSRRVRTATGLKFHVHQTRHTFACRWLERGGSITALQEILGHGSVVTTQRYGRPNEAAIRREAERSWTA
jgi:integrase